MNSILKYIAAGSAIALSMAACTNKIPAFDDADSYAAFEKTTYSVKEDAKKLVIPVTIASINPKQTVVTYEIIDGTAEKGVDFTLGDETGTLTFDGTVRTQEIVINVSDVNVGTYTKDKTFSIKLLSGGKVGLGAEDVCNVTIEDIDHPLAAILGQYTATATDEGKGAETWSLTISKDKEDTKVVWVDYICPFASSNPTYNFAVSGKVSDDKLSIVFTLGQKPGAQYTAGDYFTFCEYLGNYNANMSGTITFSSEHEGGPFTTENGVGFVTNDYVWNGARILPGTSVWTKIK